MTDSETETRVELEIRLAHQEHQLQELSDVLAEQWKTVEQLQRKVGQLEDRLRRAEGELHDLNPDEPPPPHY